MSKICAVLVMSILLGCLIIPSHIFAERGGSGNREDSLGSQEDKHEANFGHVKKIEGSKLTFEDDDKKASIEATVDKDTKVQWKGKSSLKFSQIHVDDTVAVISTDSGEHDNKEHRILKIFVKRASDSAQMKRRAVEGVVTSISGSTITLVHQIHSDRTTTITVTANTVIKLKGTQNATLSSIQTGQRIVAIGDLGTDGVLVANRIHVIPGKAKGIFNKFPTVTPGGSESASLTPTGPVTGTITPTVTLTPTPTDTLTPTP